MAQTKLKTRKDVIFPRKLIDALETQPDFTSRTDCILTLLKENTEASTGNSPVSAIAASLITGLNSESEAIELLNKLLFSINESAADAD